MSRPRVFAVAGVVLAFVAGGVGLAALHVAPDGRDLAWLLAAILLSIPSLALGVLVAGREPAGVVGLLLTSIGLVVVAVAATDAYGAAVRRAPGELPTSDEFVSLLQGGWIWLYVPIALLVLVFPDGRLPSRRWRPVAIAVPAVAVSFNLLAAVAPGAYPAPYASSPHALGTAGRWAGLSASALLPLVLALLLASAVSTIVRYRGSGPQVRAQLRWFALAGTTVPGALLVCWASYLLLGGPDLVVLALAIMYVAVPGATAVAILRYDLYDVDRVVSATVTYGLVSAGLLAVFGVVSLLGGVVIGGGSTVTSAAATAACAAALVPLRERLRGRVDGWLYPTRRGALLAIDALRWQMHRGEAPPEQLESVLRTALRDPHIRIGYVVPGGTGFVDAQGLPLAPSERGTAIRLGADQIGAMWHGPACAPPLAREVADAASLLVEVVRLRLELHRAVADVGSSRARLLHAAYEERRRLELDLHDGAQQRLVSLGMALRLAQRHVGSGTVDVDDLIDRSVAELGTAISELRQLAHGIRPSSLDEGLAPALATLTRSIPVDVDLDLDLGDVDVTGDVSTTAYYVVSEAVANAVKHATPRRIGVTVVQQNGRLLVRVKDDGCGGARVRRGSGLAGLGDRVAAVGGTLAVSSPRTGGTVLEAVLPCGS